MEVLLDRPDREGIQPLSFLWCSAPWHFEPFRRPNLAFSCGLLVRYEPFTRPLRLNRDIVDRYCQQSEILSPTTELPAEPTGKLGFLKYFSRDLAPFEFQLAADIAMRNSRLTWLMDCKFLWKLRDIVNGMIRPLVIHETGLQNAVRVTRENC